MKYSGRDAFNRHFLRRLGYVIILLYKLAKFVVSPLNKYLGKTKLFQLIFSFGFEFREIWVMVEDR